LPEQKDETDMGGSLRLGANEIKINKDSLAHKIYNSGKVFKRHRHRYEFNTKYREEFLCLLKTLPELYILCASESLLILISLKLNIL
jgi:hypothetical protein